MVARAQDSTASDTIKTPQEAAQRLCNSGSWLVINKYSRLDPETDSHALIVTVVFRHLSSEERLEVWDETLEVGSHHEFFWRWLDLWMGHEVHFLCSQAPSRPRGFYTREVAHPEILEKSYFLVPIR